MSTAPAVAAAGTLIASRLPDAVGESHIPTPCHQRLVEGLELALASHLCIMAEGKGALQDCDR